MVPEGRTSGKGEGNEEEVGKESYNLGLCELRRGISRSEFLGPSPADVAGSYQGQ